MAEAVELAKAEVAVEETASVAMAAAEAAGRPRVKAAAARVANA